jgi:methylmalonyl-CoA/ethylmalonyl-CoA epimerase
MSHQVEHIAIKVDDVDESAKTLQRMGFELVVRQSFPDIGIDLAELEIGGLRFELLRAMHEQSPIAKDKEGLHHVALRVENLQAAYDAACGDERVEVVGPPRPGRTGSPVFFARVPNSSLLLEYVS